MRIFLPIALLLMATGCFPGPSGVDVDRSFREFQLASALHAEQNIPGAITHLRRALELDDENAEAHILFGLIHYGRNNLPLAEEHCQRGVDLLVEHERPGATLAEARNVLGVILIDREKYEEATVVLEASAMDGMNTAPHLAWGNLGLAQLKLGRHQEALESLSESVRIQARFCVGYHRMGQAFYELERWEEAEQALIAALEADEVCEEMPSLQNAWRLRAEVRAQLGRHRDAVSDLERCVAFGTSTRDGAACQRLLDSTAAEIDAVDDGGDFDEPEVDGADV